ncbi:MAG: T9SS C-terminal target domain-containing protein [Calditrichaeota bacterium]|nr:MAG: T9SS C-terminal target domain-containing protein [Calditrichota bacterium]
MKCWLLILLTAVSGVMATTVNGTRNVSINGTIQGENGATNGTNGSAWENDEVQLTSTSGVSFYLSWDDTNLYVGWVGGSKAQQHILWIDTDPQPAATDGSGSTSTFDYGNVTATLPFTGNFFVNIQDAYNEYRTNTTGIWSTGTSGALTVAASSSTDDIEAVIPWNTITNGAGRPGSIYFLSYINDPAGGGGTGFVYGNAPSQNSNAGGGNQTFTHYFGQTVNGGVNPFGTVDASLAVEWAAVNATFTEGRVIVEWKTASEINNVGFRVYRRSEQAREYRLLADYQSTAALRGAGSSSHAHSYRYTDNDILEKGVYFYRLASVDYAGMVSYSAGMRVEVNATPVYPVQTELGANYPNPFNPRTEIEFSLSRDDYIELNVFDRLGRLVRTLQRGRRSAGTYRITFDATGLASGVYFYQLSTASGVRLSRRMEVIK